MLKMDSVKPTFILYSVVSDPFSKPATHRSDYNRTPLQAIDERCQLYRSNLVLPLGNGGKTVAFALDTRAWKTQISPPACEMCLMYVYKCIYAGVRTDASNI